MEEIRNDTIGGVNAFVAEQAKQPGECHFTLTQFDTEFDLVYSGPVAKFPDLTSETYVPRGMTALWDAMGKAIVAAGTRFKNMPDNARPGKVIFVIYTDGFENSSQEFKPAALKALIERQRSVYKWDFIFLGANQDAVLTAKDLGISNSMSVAPTTAGTASTYVSTSALINAKRASADWGASLTMNYSDADRQTQVKEGAQP